MAQHRAPRKHVATWIVITVLLAAAVIGTLWVPFYNHLTPTLGDDLKRVSRQRGQAI